MHLIIEVFFYEMELIIFLNFIQNDFIHFLNNLIMCVYEKK